MPTGTERSPEKLGLVQEFLIEITITGYGYSER